MEDRHFLRNQQLLLLKLLLQVMGPVALGPESRGRCTGWSPGCNIRMCGRLPANHTPAPLLVADKDRGSGFGVSILSWLGLWYFPALALAKNKQHPFPVTNQAICWCFYSSDMTPGLILALQILDQQEHRDIWNKPCLNVGPRHCWSALHILWLTWPRAWQFDQMERKKSPKLNSIREFISVPSS